MDIDENDDHPEKRRTDAIHTELDRAASDYLAAKQAFESARVTFEAARARFETVRKLSSSMLSTFDYRYWMSFHAEIKYAGMTAGAAILEVLERRAHEAAREHLENPERQRFAPALFLDDIVDQLVDGGYEFRSTARAREVNAALIHLDGVKKVHSDPPAYMLAEADDVLEYRRSLQKRRALGDGTTTSGGDGKET